MISYLGSLVQFSPAAGRAGLCRQISLCVGSTRRVLARQPEVLAASPRVWRAFSLHGERPGRPEAWRPLPWCGAPFPSAASGPGSQRLGALSTGAPHLFPLWRAAWAARGLAPSLLARCAFSLCGPSTRHRSGLRKSSDRNRGLFAGWEGVASLGLSLPLSLPRCLLPPAGMGRFFSGVSQSLCFANRRRCVPAG